MEGKELGLHILNNIISDATSIIMKPEDIEEVKKVKSVIAPMLALDSSSRLSIHDTVICLSQLLTSISVHVPLAVCTAWKPHVIYSELIIFLYIELSFHTQ